MGLCTDGYAEASSEDFAKTPKPTLKPWGRIRGDVMVKAVGARGWPMNPPA